MPACHLDQTNRRWLAGMQPYGVMALVVECWSRAKCMRFGWGKFCRIATLPYCAGLRGHESRKLIESWRNHLVSTGVGGTMIGPIQSQTTISTRPLTMQPPQLRQPQWWQSPVLVPCRNWDLFMRMLGRRFA